MLKDFTAIPNVTNQINILFLFAWFKIKGIYLVYFLYTTNIIKILLFLEKK